MRDVERSLCPYVSMPSSISFLFFASVQFCLLLSCVVSCVACSRLCYRVIVVRSFFESTLVFFVNAAAAAATVQSRSTRFFFLL